MLGSPQPATIEDCGSSAFGPSVRPSAHDVAFGPFRLVGARHLSEEPPKSFTGDSRGRYRASKIPAALKRGRRARLSVVHKDRRNASLMYASPEAEVSDNHYPRYRLSAGTKRQRFVACDDRDWTVWPGYLVVRGPRCVGLKVRVGRREPVRRRLSFGGADCR